MNDGPVVPVVIRTLQVARVRRARAHVRKLLLLISEVRHLDLSDVLSWPAKYRAGEISGRQ